MLFVLIIAFTTLCQARVVLEDSIVYGSSSEFTRLHPADPSSPLKFTVALSNGIPLDELLLNVSTPTHASYGQHLIQSELSALLAPSPSSLQTIRSWLLDGGATSIALIGHNDIFSVTTSVASAEQLLDTEFHVYVHSASGREVTRCSRPYSVPSSVHQAGVVLVNGIVRFPNLNPRYLYGSSTPSATPLSSDCGTRCSDRVTPGVLRSRYKVPDTVAGAAEKARFAVAEFQGQKWDQHDLDLFSTACKLPNITVSTQVGSSEGKICAIPIFGQGACQESMLDIEFIAGLSPSIPLTDVYESNYDILSWAGVVANMSDTTIPLTNSLSYGNDEAQQTSVAYMNTVNRQFAALGVRGVSVLVASGDQGPCGREGCGSVYHPDFPASSPYVTAVGGTDFVTKSVIGPEMVWSSGGSGFSNTFNAPSYQQQAIASYKSTAAGKLPPQTKWNATGRAYPDVSALGGGENPYCMSIGSLMGVSVYGTSAATPVVSSVFAQLNAVRLAAGKSPMGFLNPWIYQNMDAFNDVAAGVSTGGGKDGFPATKGWDAASGVGTPNYAAMVMRI